MRMWMLPPAMLCDKHLLGEHGEIHKHRHNFVKKYSIRGRIHPVVQIQPMEMEQRHNQLAEEMLRRGMNHKSPYQQPELDYLPIEHQTAKVDIEQSQKDLLSRCDNCASRIVVE